MPDHVRTQLRYEAETYRNAITLMEYRLVDLDVLDGDWFRTPFARVRFFRSRGWELYWADRDNNFHEYQFVSPTQNIPRLLNEIREDPTCIFFG